MTIARAGRPFNSTEREVFLYLVGQAAASVENVALHELVSEQAVTDDLTGLANNRAFHELMDKEAARARRFGHDLSLLILDIDDFKRVNDTYGHPQGDAVLKAIGRILADESRGIDVPARYGGEEFVVALPETDAGRCARARRADPGADRGRARAAARRRRDDRGDREPRPGDPAGRGSERGRAVRERRRGPVRREALGQEPGGGRAGRFQGERRRWIGREGSCGSAAKVGCNPAQEAGSVGTTESAYRSRLRNTAQRWEFSTTRSESTSI